jgi:hypothetical protein
MVLLEISLICLAERTQYAITESISDSGSRWT